MNKLLIYILIVFTVACTINEEKTRMQLLRKSIKDYKTVDSIGLYIYKGINDDLVNFKIDYPENVIVHVLMDQADSIYESRLFQHVTKILKSKKYDTDIISIQKKYFIPYMTKFQEFKDYNEALIQFHRFAIIIMKAKKVKTTNNIIINETIKKLNEAKKIIFTNDQKNDIVDLIEQLRIMCNRHYLI